MNKIIALILALKMRFADNFSPDITTLIGKVSKMEAQIETAIEKADRQLEALHYAATEILAQRDAASRELDAGYKLLHNVSSLTR